MVQAGVGGLDTPRTNLGDATYLSNQQLDFDITQESSFQSPSKDKNNLVHQMQNGRRGAVIKTPRSRVALSDRRNLPAGLGGGEFTPLLKSATRNSALRNGKENAIQTPAFLRPGGLDNIPEDLSPAPFGSSVYGNSRNGSYMSGTPAPNIDSSSTASTPMALLPRRTADPGVLQDGNQLSLREQENVIDKIEKENFGLKLKIHFLEEALRKAGPGFSEAALKENTELKVDKVTMQKELLRYRKTLNSAERDVELYRQQFMELQDKVKRKHLDDGQREELSRLQRALEDKEAELNRLKSQENDFDDLRDKIHDLEADLREKNRIIDGREDEVESLKEDLEKRDADIQELEIAVKQSKRREVELEEEAQAGEELDEAKETVEELEQDLKRLKEEVEDAKEERQDALREKERAEADLEELQEEMANKSVTTKGLNRQIEEKGNRLQDEVEELREKHASLQQQYSSKLDECKNLENDLKSLKQESQSRERKLKDQLDTTDEEKNKSIRERDFLSKRLEDMQKDLQQISDEKHILQNRHDALTTESSGLQRDLDKARKAIEILEDKLDHEKTLALNNEREVRNEYKSEIDRLNDEIEDLGIELREKERVYDADNDKWDSERRKLESQKEMVDERATGLQRTIDRLQAAEGTLSGKEAKLQEALQSERDRHHNQVAVLTRQIAELNDDVEARRKALEDIRSELATVREELRLSQREQSAFSEKVEGLEDEIEILQTTLDDESEQAKHEITAARQESQNFRRQLDSLQKDLARAEATAADARAEIEAFQGDLKVEEGTKEQLSLRLGDVGNQLSRVRQDKTALQDQLAGMNTEMHSLRASKADLEAEIDDMRHELKSVKQQDNDTCRLDQERTEFRTAKLKLDAAVRRLKEENKLALAQQQSIEKELQQEIDRASEEEARLSTEIHDLQRILRGSSEKRELASAKKHIQELEARIHELEKQLAVDNTQAYVTNELSIIRRDLRDARQKETEYLQREAAQKDNLQNLKRQITELERKAHDTEISRFVSTSPHSSVNGSARKSEGIEVRAQLATAHQTLKELRTQLKEVEKEASRKVTAANIELQAQSQAWESAKDKLEHSLNEAQLAKQELEAKNSACEATISRLRSKIDRLEKALDTERQTRGEDRIIASERHDLHEMLRESQLQVESLEIVVQERESTIATITAAELELRAQLKRIREERDGYRSKAAASLDQLDDVQRKYNRAKSEWRVEREQITRGVRFANVSMSETGNGSQLMQLHNDFAEKEHIHIKQMRGMQMQLDWLRARCKREGKFREEAAYAKRYMGMQIALYRACNEGDLELIRTIPGIPHPPTLEPKKKTFKHFGLMVCAIMRMKKGAVQWKEKTKINEKLTAKIKEQEAEAALEAVLAARAAKRAQTLHRTNRNQRAVSETDTLTQLSTQPPRHTSREQRAVSGEAEARAGRNHRRSSGRRMRSISNGRNISV